MIVRACTTICQMARCRRNGDKNLIFSDRWLYSKTESQCCKITETTEIVVTSQGGTYHSASAVLEG